MDVTGYKPDFWAKALYQGHGYAAIQQRFHALDTTKVIWHYPCNLAVLQNALGVLVHSENSRRLASQWVGKNAADDWTVVPLLRRTALDIDPAEARRLLKLGKDDFMCAVLGYSGQPSQPSLTRCMVGLDFSDERQLCAGICR